MEPKIENSEKELTLTDEDGNEYRFEILFTYDNEERGASYVLFFDPASPEEIMIARYEDDGTLDMELNDDEFNEANEILNTYNEDPQLK
ncbi:MAG: DUF1292 domain-containing protein [Bacilli bacterium]|jgi:uncharacterized protein YrzB (UPF0473 family)|nr:DUF1292 domain-containing protein [Bacilli bacterium]MCH4201684.1 DUF1292 domain-containing protein [Bacilli bacterium]MCH4235266.1 DUF1292 domain-containing protein [Bacilli bacterium]